MGAIGILCGRCRAALFRFRGGAISEKCTFGARVKIDHPRQVSVLERATFESDVWLKLVSDNAGVVIGAFTFLGRGTELDVLQQVSIGSHVLIGPGVFITDHNHRIEMNELIDQQGCSSAAVIIEDDVWLGAKVVVLPGVTIHRGAVVGAGAVVTKDLPANSISVGVPARVIGFRNRSRSESV
jgi:acetyltransferase-like isoleucine patch superfamily enzyme